MLEGPISQSKELIDFSEKSTQLVFINNMQVYAPILLKFHTW